MMSTRVLKSTILKRKKVMIVFDDMIADVIINKKFHTVVTELFIGGLLVPKDVKLNTKKFFIMNISNKRNL